MESAPLPPDEDERLAALCQLDVLDTPPEPELDAIAELARDLMETPIALVSLVDADRQWFKARVGLDATETPRRLSFCAHAVVHRTTLVVPDALADPRFVDNPLVTGPTQVRYYVGAPLVTAAGHALGALCVIDHHPRPPPDPRKVAHLETLAGQVVRWLTLRRESGRARELSARIARMEQRLVAAEERTRQAADAAHDAIVVIDAEGTVVFANRRTEQLFGHPVGELVGGKLERLIPERLRRAHGVGLRRHVETGRSRTARGPVVLPGLHRDGHEIPVELSLSELTWEDGQRFVGYLRDVRDREGTVARLRVSEERHRLAAKAQGMALFEWDLAANRCWSSPELEGLLGQPRTPREHLLDGWLTAHVHPDDQDPLRAELDVHLDGLTPRLDVTIRVVRADGDHRHLRLRAQAAAGRDQEERRSRLVGAAEDISAEIRQDALTGLANLAGLDAALRGSASTRDGPPALLVLRVDGFGLIDQTLGRRTADALLAVLARRLEDLTDPGEMVARTGPAEFAAMLHRTGPDGGARAFVDRVAESLDAPVLVHGQRAYVSMGAGVVVAAERDRGLDGLLADARAALDRAQGEGRGRYAVFDDGMRRAAGRRFALESGLRAAIDKDQLFLLYQPIVDLASGRLQSFEALLRWRDDDGQTVSPGEFIPVAESTDLIVPIGGWVLERVAELVHSWQQRMPMGPVPSVAVNVSGRQLLRPDFLERLDRVLGEVGLDPSGLTVEVTESTLLEDVVWCREQLRAIRRRGVRVSLDDFGTGYSSLAYLRQFEVDLLKIDRSFVQDVCGSRLDQGLVRTIIGLAREMGAAVVAEGIETREQLAALRRLGCAYGQGFLFARPMPMTEAEAAAGGLPPWSASLCPPGPATESSEGLRRSTAGVAAE
jgi:PAS domain S-box-containing protein/diguanylate cyclase (GGDEF)-like protein